MHLPDVTPQSPQGNFPRPFVGMRRLQEGAVGEKLRPTGDQTVQWSSLALPDLTANWAGSLSVFYTGNIYNYTAATQALAGWLLPSGWGTAMSHRCPPSPWQCPAEPSTGGPRPSSERGNLSFFGRVLTWLQIPQQEFLSPEFVVLAWLSQLRHFLPLLVLFTG